MRKRGQTQFIRSIGVGKSIVVDPKRVSSANNLHVLANRQKIKIATRTVDKGKHAGKLEVFRLK
jgi:hypothetical protein